MRRSPSSPSFISFVDGANDTRRRHSSDHDGVLHIGGRALARVVRLRRGMAPAGVRTLTAAPASVRLRHGGVFLKKSPTCLHCCAVCSTM
jgi:hypothetical protein